MRSTLCLLILLSTFFGTSSGARELSGVTLPDRATVENTPLYLNGLGERTYLFATVYVAGLYLPAKSKDSSQILQSKEPAQVTMRFKHDVGEKDMRDAWSHFLELNAGSNWAQIKPKAEAYLKVVPGVKKGEDLTHVFTKDGFRVLLNQKEIANITDHELGTLVLSTWIGPHPTTEEMKKGLLGIN